MKSLSAGAVAAALLAAAGTHGTGGAGIEPISLVAGAVSADRPPGFETTLLPASDAPYRTVTFRGPARRQGDFNDCSVRVVPVAPDDVKGTTIGEIAAAQARNLHAVHQMIDSMYDLSLGGPAPGRANDPWTVRWSFTLGDRLRMSERYWGVSAAGWDYLIVQNCQTGGSPEELAVIEELTRPLFAAP